MSAVLAYDEWPRCSWTTLVCVPAASRKLAAECRRGVQVDAAEAGPLREDLEAPQHVAGLQRCTDLGGEDQPVLLPGSGGRALFLQLPGPGGHGWPRWPSGGVARSCGTCRSWARRVAAP